MLSLVSLNTERGKHFTRNLPYFKESRPDIICFQEVPERIFWKYETELGMKGVFSPMAEIADAGRDYIGLGILSSLPISKDEAHVYWGDPTEIKLAPDDNHDHFRFLVSWITVEHEGKVYKVGTTHAPWHPNPNETLEIQKKAAFNLKGILTRQDHFVLTGDFNHPRGKGIFEEFSEVFIDHIPPSVETTIDGDLHRAGKLSLVVDGLFSTAHYKTRNVDVVSGLSDHCAITAELEKIGM